ncbi:MAG: GTPase ObgE, GTP-binding protein [Candidatus Parcubacteria bacterium]|jgi:GTP-binding protein
MLVDKITIKVEAGRGGPGVVRWRKEKFIDRGGPWGGNGGKGGDIYMRAIRDVYALRRYDNNRTYRAKDGESGHSRLMDGESAPDIILDIPVGSIVYNHEYNTYTRFDTEGEVKLIVRGGKGGYGNNHFKSSTNQTPMESTPGAAGDFATLDIEVEMIAKVGFIGLPNAGKSSILNELTRAKAKTANYAFTTLEPNLGDFHGFILADLPGLIEGAAEGKGLGHRFLKHIKRTEIVVHLVSAENEDVTATYTGIRSELGKYDAELLVKREIVILSKSDMVDATELAQKQKALEKVSNNIVHTMSLYDNEAIDKFAKYLRKILEDSVAIPEIVANEHVGDARE